MNIKNLIIRAGAGIVYVLIVLLGIFGGRFSFLAVFGLLAALALFEFLRMMEKNTSHAISKIFNIASGATIFFSVYLYLENICVYALPFFVSVYLLALFASGVFIKRINILHAIIYSVFGQIYITLPMSLLMFISYKHASTADYSYVFVLAIFVFIWINDTGAYLVGSLLGKHKLIERISPKKSVEGFVGGIILSVASSLLFAHLVPVYPLLFWIGFAFITSLFGTLGDLFESLIKRTYYVKDSGHLIPGHGGILDRIDSLLLAIPAIFLYLMFFFRL